MRESLSRVLQTNAMAILLRRSQAAS